MLPASEIKMIRSLSDKKFRDRTGLFIVEGEKLADEALRSGFIVEKIYRRDEIGEAAMQRISATASGSPVLALVRKPLDIRLESEDSYRSALGSSGLFIALDSIRDPGNLGTILRACLGFTLPDLAIIRPAADVFDPRVVRASMGALFSMRVALYDSFEEYRAQHPGHALYPFMLDGSLPLPQARKTAKTPYALVFGNEATGLPASFASLGQPVRIPQSDAIDSLNLSVAVSIAAYAFTQEA